MAAQFNFRPSLKKYLKSSDGWINFCVALRTETGTVEQAIVFQNGRVRVLKKIPEKVDVTMRFINDDVLKEMSRITPNEILNLILKNQIILDGNFSYLQLFNYYISLLMGKKHRKMLNKANQEDLKSRKKEYGIDDPKLAKELAIRKNYRMKGTNEDKGVKFLIDPYLAEYSLADFPRVKKLHTQLFNTRPEISSERPKLLTEWFRKNGFEDDINGNPWVPELRQAYAFKYLMENKKTKIQEDCLLAGTTTPEDIGIIVYPDTTGTLIWGELGSVENRVLNPYGISKKTAARLHDIFPFWAKRNIKHWISKKYDSPLCQKIDDRFVASFNFKSISISHTVPDLPKVVKKGITGIIEQIETELAKTQDTDRTNALESMRICLEGVNTYAQNLSKKAYQLTLTESNKKRKKELENLGAICRKVPSDPSETLDEAINSAWIFLTGIFMENTNVSISPGRLDQLFQPYFENDIKKLTSSAEKKEYIEHAIELISCFFLRCSDHQMLVPDIGNYLFGGSQTDTAITLGGVTAQGEDAVNDMTYIFLKVTEMLSLSDPNMNARYKTGVSSDTYLKRLCEVNYITVATPSMHCDDAVIDSFRQSGAPIEDLRNWAATGCVEVTLSGKHMGHTGSTSVNMVAALEMALNNGYHPLMNWNLGPKTGCIEDGDFESFDDFFQAYVTQQKFLIDQTIRLNNMAAEAYTWLRPTPLLSTVIEGAISNGCDVTKGGAVYNTSGSFNIGLADVIDSLMVIKKLVFDEKKILFADLKKAIDTNFKDNFALHAMTQNKVPRFGSGNDEAVEMANRVTGIMHDCYKANKNFRGGDYTVGFWSVAQHVAYGTLSGALPSGRLAYTPFTPGLTPHASASKSFLDNIRDVARLDPVNMDNNIAFNVKLVPGPKDTREKTVEHMHSYIKTYFDQGGMQMQFNVVNSKVLKDAMANPENYKNLLVRISGYNAYFVGLNKDLQMELIERAEYGL
jgi:formate C-acetyltransferase